MPSGNKNTGMATFFATAEEFAAWLEKQGATQTEFVVGYYKRASQRPSMTWAESVDAALCFGWIDGVRKRIDEHSYQIRFQRKTAALKRRDELRFRKSKAAWAFFKAQPPSYRQLVIWRIVSAKRAETRERRSADLIKASQELRRL
jgi:uncharacterized protein YdeI (YjbR/CyaY-like superfamily)